MSRVLKFLAATAQPVGDRQVRVICSTASVDRMGEVVEQRGIGFGAYEKGNPIVLASHDPAQPIGRASELSVAGGALRALVTFAPPGVSAEADKWCGLVKAGVVTGVSIGFDPTETEPMDARLPRGPQRYLSCELLEISFVSIPANAGAGVVERSFSPRSDLTAKIAALHRRWRLLAEQGKGLTYQQRRAEANALALAHHRRATNVRPASTPSTRTVRLAEVARLAPRHPNYSDYESPAHYAAAMRAHLEGRR